MAATDERLFRTIVESTTDAILSTSPDGVVETWNGGAERLFGYRTEEIAGFHVLRLVPRENRASAVSLLQQVAAGEVFEAIEGRRLGRDGSVTDVSLSASPMRSPDGAVIGLAIVVRDISSHKKLEHRLLEMALRDPLTGLYNRRQFEAELDRELALSKRKGHHGAVLVMDLDQFKAVNDTFGHAAGDEMLRGVAEVLTDRLRESDLVARIGGDEFAAILPDVDPAHAQSIARSLEERVRGLRHGSGGTISTSASIGVAEYGPAGAESRSELLERADDAMYVRKRERLIS